MLPPTTPKPLRKSELKEILKGFAQRIVRKEINEVIVEIRKVPESEAKNIKTLYPSEVTAVLSRFE